ncbi:unnamed protein product [Nyctereutes procyonoides]|uniref:(raccoon dog) hypothetical protein n=1 Tax=Nyctereutes procyonoides TaxID=34880 RepID=A0A811ZQI2_NYCPR|nr:unnamed protein product [Nyctereutes procyonoides]
MSLPLSVWKINMRNYLGKSQVKSWVLLHYPVTSDKPPNCSENTSSCAEKSRVTVKPQKPWIKNIWKLFR